MHTFEKLSTLFAERFNQRHFPETPTNLYDAGEYFLNLQAKRIRPVLCLMGNELFGDIRPDVYHVASAIELFHNFTLIHDDIMDKAPLRRGQQTVHERFGSSTALLAGDVMLVAAYDHLNKIDPHFKFAVLDLFNKTAREVCEGQQLDMDFEKQPIVQMDAYIRMITLKTSVLLASSLQLGAILGGAGLGNQEHIYEFGKCLGIAFQVQDDYLDAFGDPTKFGKQVGGDILSDKKTFLLIKALEAAKGKDKEALEKLLKENSPRKVEEMVSIFRSLQVDKWAFGLKKQYMGEALRHLEEIAVLSSRKKPLEELAEFLVQRDY
ncbi:MAG TPA: polyprenyl synthetase family protein [Flavitalea sp.]|nr:polyprenyl synthetase family protein [Flavitalea sp.]